MIEELVAHIFTGFTDVAAGLHKSAIHTPSILTIAKYLIIFHVVPVAAVITYDHYYPIFEGVNLYLVIIISTPILLVTPALLFALFHFTGGHWLLNWRLRKASRYLHFCQLPPDYTELLVPKDTTNWHHQLAGSSADHGFGFFPLLSTNSGILPRSNPYLVQDVDINVFYKPLRISTDDLIPIAPGYCHVAIKESIKDVFLEDCIIKSVKFGRKSLLSGRLISKKIGMGFAGGDIEYNYPAMTFKKVLRGPRGEFRFNSDVVFGIKILHGAALACDWFERVKDVFPRQVLNRVRDVGCYVVHKHCTSTHPSHDFDWRVSFAEAESKLFEYHCDKRALKLCYVVIKFAIKQFSQIKRKSYPALKSYHLKTVILWIAEQSDNLPFDMYCTDNNKTLDGLFLYIISTYRRHLHDGHLQHYFIKGINILEPYDVEDRTSAIDLLDEFKMKPLTIVSNFDNANLNRWKFDQFLIVSLLVGIACTCFNCYFSNVGKLFAHTSVVRQIFWVCGVFGVILIVKIWLD